MFDACPSGRIIREPDEPGTAHAASRLAGAVQCPHRAGEAQRSNGMAESCEPRNLAGPDGVIRLTALAHAAG